jgi:ferritin-like metal-binding protein YciE
METKTSNQKKTFEESVDESQLMKMFENELKDIYWVEKTLTSTIPKMVENATNLTLNCRIGRSFKKI